MPARAARSSPHPDAIAPDGIPIHLFALPGGVHAGVAEGRMPPGRYAIHRHLSLEQYTYVISGVVSVITADAEHPDGHAVTLRAGDLLLTLPGESLKFVNEGSDTARVLFICAPPYPQDNRDTRILADHGALPRSELAAAIARLQAVRAEINAAIDERIASLRAIAEAAPRPW